MKAKVKRLLELLEHNTHSLWDTNLQYTTDCIILEDKELKDMVYEEDTEESDFKNHIFNGNELCKLIEELKKEVSFDQSSLSQNRPYIRYKTSVLKQMLEECNETYEMYKINKELELRKDIGSPNTRNQFVVCRRGEEVGVVVQRVIFL